MAKFIELSNKDEKFLINIETISFVFPEDGRTKIYTTCQKRDVAYCSESYDYVKEQIAKLSE